ncbi:uncharacterized protein LOC126881617 [Diabrotica virgifera virgifera]|uniref:Uncharacterized protein n=2 Tax=Diabrotica virgifera virgifera TaxID=50390 RepID=A0ABM5JVH4_DIAVI|nr:uncharacterized protein LOC126881617 [Diabrotica virgifera virgifera]
MKKVIQSKHFTKNCPEIRKVPDGPKQLLFNNWATRNDSSKVAALLHPDDYLEKPRRYLKDVPHKANRKADKETGVYRKCCMGTNTCYCREESIKPSLLRRPNKCLSLEAFEERFKEKLPIGRNSLHCFCKAGSASAENINLSDHEILQKYQEELECLNKNLQITDQRKDYEIFRDNEHLQYLKNIGQYKNSTLMSRLPHIPAYYFSNSHSKNSNLFRKNSRSAEDIDIYDEEHRSNYLPREKREVYPKQRSNYKSLDNYEETLSRQYPKDNDEGISSNGRQKEASLENYRNGSSSSGRTCLRSKCDRKFSVKQRTSVADNEDLQKINFTNNRFDPSDEEDAEEEEEEFYATRPKTVNAAMNTDQFKRFRNENYFETHDLEEHLVEDIPAHTCVHRYDLNERNMPIGVNVDIYGQSRCSICNKPMEDLQEKPYFSDKISPSRLKNLSKCYQLGLAPTTVIRSSSSIEIKVDRDNICPRFIGRCQRTQYKNTFALRQQKMATYRQENVY